LGIDDRDATKIKKTIMVQRFGGYQNEYLLAERLPETNSVWDVLQQSPEGGEEFNDDDDVANICQPVGDSS